jgi:hypothetical protein
LLVAPVAVYASHIFSDVPTSNTFHGSISALYGSRITGGCGGGKYCPNSAVTRGQMAAFLVRGLGRMASAEDGAGDGWAAIQLAEEPGPPPFHPFGIVAPLTLTHGGGVGGTAHVFATATVNVWTDEPTVCPCEVQAFLVNTDTNESSQAYFQEINSELAPADPDFPAVQYAEGTLSLSFAFSVSSGVQNDYGVAVKVVSTNPPTPDHANTGWAATLQTVYVPFNATGGNPTLPTNTQGRELHPHSPRLK